MRIQTSTVKHYPQGRKLPAKIAALVKRANWTWDPVACTITSPDSTEPGEHTYHSARIGRALRAWLGFAGTSVYMHGGGSSPAVLVKRGLCEVTIDGGTYPDKAVQKQVADKLEALVRSRK